MMKLKPRFGLRTMLGIVLGCAIAACAYWILWPNWLAYQDGVDFERRAKTLRAGPAQDLFKVLPNNGSLTWTQMFDSEDATVEICPFRFKYAWYCVYVKRSADSPDSDRRFSRQQQWNEVRVYRLEPPPRTYRAQTAAGAATHLRLKSGQPTETVEPDYAEQFLRDFYEIATGRESRDLGILFEPIHSDSSGKRPSS